MGAPKRPSKKTSTVNADKREFLSYGSTVSLLSEEGYFIAADGIISQDVRGEYSEINEPRHEPRAFRNCVFTIMPMQQYSAQKEFQEFSQLHAAPNEANDPVSVMMESLQVAARKEINMNEQHI